jgi:hypothetical protein
MFIKTFLNIPTVDAVKNEPKFTLPKVALLLQNHRKPSKPFCACIFGVKITAVGMLAHFLMRCKNCVIFVNFRSL